MADNKTTDTSEFDLLSEDFELSKLEDLGFDEVDFNLGETDMLSDLQENNFSDSIKEDSDTFDFILTFPKE